MCSLYISYNRYHGVFRKVLFVAVLFWSRLVHADLAMHATLAALCSGREACMLTSRCMLPWLRSAPYPALCPCEPLGPVGDMQAVSYGVRSRQHSPLLPASLLFWSRLVHAALAMHATLAALGTLPRSMSL